MLATRGRAYPNHLKLRETQYHYSSIEREKLDETKGNELPGYQVINTDFFSEYVTKRNPNIHHAGLLDIYGSAIRVRTLSDREEAGRVGSGAFKITTDRVRSPLIDPNRPDPREVDPTREQPRYYYIFNATIPQIGHIITSLYQVSGICLHFVVYTLRQIHPSLPTRCTVWTI